MFPSSSTPAPPLPTPQVTELADGLSLLAPLSRRGSGPGLIVVVPDTTKGLDIENNIPAPFIKWAEESYTVVQIQAKALGGDVKAVLAEAVKKLSASEKTEPKGVVGLVAYDPKLWNCVASALSAVPEIVGAVVYADAADLSSLEKASIPTVAHLSGKASAKLERSESFTAYDYPGRDSFSFAIPFQEKFHYASESISHTRNLTFLKKRMNGPYFDLEYLWDEHTYYEFEDRSVEHTMSTMVQEPYVNHVPTMTGGIGRERLTDFYRNHFIFKNPPDTELELVSRTIGIDRVVDEFIYKFTHTSEVDWLAPGVPPTGKRVEVPFSAVVNIRGDRLYHEHITWDQASVLVQMGLLPQYLPFPYPLPDGTKPANGKSFEYRVPAAGLDTAEKMRDKNSIESNLMFNYKVREV